MTAAPDHGFTIDFWDRAIRTAKEASKKDLDNVLEFVLLSILTADRRKRGQP